MPNVMVFEGGAYRRYLVHEDGTLMNKIHDLIKETPQRPLTPSTMWGCSDKSVIWKRVLTGPWWNPDVGLLGSREK